MAHKTFGDAQILTAYTLNSWFVTFSPWFEGDSMLASFVKKGSKGQNNIKIYINLRDFEKLLASIEDGSFTKALAADNKSDTPSAWTYRTGNNGSKSFAIGLGKENAKTGKRSIVLHGYDATKRSDSNADVPVTWDKLEELKENYRLIVGPKPADNCWHAMLWDAFWKAYDGKKKFYEQEQGEDDKEGYTESADTAAEEVKTETAPSDDKTESVQEVLLRSYVKDGDVISFDGEVEGSPAILRIPASEMGGKDKSAWSRASKELKDTQKAVITLMLRHVRNNEYTVLEVAK